VGDPLGLPYLHEAITELDTQSQTDDLATATAFLGRYYHYHARHTKAIENLEQARKLAEPIGNPQTLQTIYGHLAGAYQHLAQLKRSDEWARKTISLGEHKNHLLAQATGHEFLAESAVCRGDWDESLRQTAKNRELADKMGALNRQAWSEYPRTMSLWGKGHLVDAYQVAQTALELCERIGETRLASWIEPALALIATDLNEDEAADRYARESLRRGESLGQVALHGYSLHAMGYWHMRCQKWEEAVQYYQQLRTLLRPTENRIIFLYSQAYAAEAFLGSGRVAKSVELIDEANVLAEFAQAPHLRAMSKSIQARAFAKLKRPGKAAAAFEESIAGLDRLGSRLELGRAYYHRAEMLLEEGQFEKARVDSERALNILTGCGAKRDAHRAENLLTQLK
jgi:tetratricopeptide (TPR) repeat protein